MPDVVIRVRGLSKRYTRGPEPSLTLRRAATTILAGLPGAGRRRPPAGRPDYAARETFWALRDLTFDVTRGERVGIIGRNGAGKSTLLKILSRIVYPTEGDAWIRGRVTSLLEVGTGFNPNLSGRENVYLNASIHGLERREIDARLADIVEFSGVREFLDTPVKHYSSGMFMRLAFSVAAHLDPDILLLDEVLAVGDLSFQQKCLQRVEGLTSEGRTVLFVSHSLDAVARLCNRCLWLDHGRVIMDGPVIEVVEGYVEAVLGLQASREWVVDSPPPAADGTPPSSSNEAAPSSSNGDIPSSGGGAPQIANNAERTPDPVPAPTVAIVPGHEESGATGTSAGGPGDAPPGNTYTRLISARVVNSRGETVTSVAIDEPVGVEMVYEITQAGKNIQPALHFKTANENYAFVVAYTDPVNMRAVPDVGRYMATAWVPPNLLNAGLLSVSLVLVTPDPMERHVVMDRALSFNVHERLDTAAATARGLYAREFPGVVRPKLQWETRRIA